MEIAGQVAIVTGGGSGLGAATAAHLAARGARVAVFDIAGPAAAATAGRIGGIPVTEFIPESLGLYRDRTGPHTWSCHRGYLLTTQDKELSPGLQRVIAERFGAEWSDEIATGHLPMVQDPGATAAAIDAFRIA